MGTHPVATFAGESQSVAAARAWVTARLREWPDELPEDTLGDAQMITSEFVTNAVQAGAGPIRVSVSRSADGISIEVTDDYANALPAPRRPSPKEASGRGLQIVAALSRDWGWTPTPSGGKTVWAVLATTPDRS